MTKGDIIKEISDKSGIEKPIVAATVDAFMKVVRSSIISGEDVFLRGFGTFLLKERKERPGFDMWNQKHVVIPAHYIVNFKPVESFNEKVKKNVKVKKEVELKPKSTRGELQKERIKKNLEAKKEEGNSGNTEQ